jgi:hypothetical protein
LDTTGVMPVARSRGAQVVRIGHAIQHEQQRRTLEAVEQRVEVVRERAQHHPGDHALVSAAAGEAVEPPGGHAQQAHAGPLGKADEIARTCVRAPFVEVDLDY